MQNKRKLFRNKQRLKGSEVLTLPNFEKTFILYNDASDFGLGGVLVQIDDLGSEKVIEFASRSLKKEEKHYGITEKEALAIIWAIEYFQYYLKGRNFIIRTDHTSLENLMSSKFKTKKSLD